VRSALQVADLNRGAFGFVQLAKDLSTGEQVAIKFIERGDKARMLLLRQRLHAVPALTQSFIQPCILASAHSACKDPHLSPCCGACRSASMWSARL
jgi:serine/threonine protein kinase